MIVYASRAGREGKHLLAEHGGVLELSEGRHVCPRVGARLLSGSSGRSGRGREVEEECGRAVAVSVAWSCSLSWVGEGGHSGLRPSSPGCMGSADFRA